MESAADRTVQSCEPWVDVITLRYATHTPPTTRPYKLDSRSGTHPPLSQGEVNGYRGRQRREGGSLLREPKLKSQRSTFRRSTLNAQTLTTLSLTIEELGG